MEIGHTLRETRLRLGIEIADVEEKTKIRAKFLRALENEEWQVIPEDIYVKKFLETYASTLGLDPRPLVELYVIRTSVPENHSPRRGPRGGVPGDSGRWRKFVLGAALLTGLVVLLLVGTGQL
ncbi:MAG: helix-turn-helix domain-containing protein [Actinomycetes bacterium]